MCNFGKTASLTDEAVVTVASKHKRSASQVLGRWCVQKGFQHIPKSEKRARMDENAKIFDFALDAEDLEKLDCLTTDADLDAFEDLYKICVVRDAFARRGGQGDDHKGLT